jgi:hypothetical protein
MATRKRDKRRGPRRVRQQEKQSELERVQLLAKQIRTPEEFEAILDETQPAYRKQVESLLTPLVTYGQ